MNNKSIFSFLQKDEIFHEIYLKALEMEKNIVNEYDTAFNVMRTIIEKLVKIIVVKDQQDMKLSKELYSNYVPLTHCLYRCSMKKYIPNSFYYKLDKFVKEYGNAGSHDNDDNFKQEVFINSHKLIFDFTIFVFQRFNKKFEKNYEFDLNYLKDNNAYTKEEFTDMMSDINQNEVNQEVILQKARDEFISKSQLTEILSNYSIDIDNSEFITLDDLNHILDDYDTSIKNSIVNEINQAHNKYLNDVNEVLYEFEDNQVTLPQINKLIQENNDNLKNDILNSIKIIVKELIKNNLKHYIDELSHAKVIENNQIIDAPKYEIIETEESFEIKEIEEMLGIPDRCPKCDAQLIKGSTKCPNCDYDLFDELNKRCPKCGKRIPLGSKFCIRCGNDLDKWKCDKCGYKNKKDTKFCVKCGNKL